MIKTAASPYKKKKGKMSPNPKFFKAETSHTVSFTLENILIVGTVEEGQLEVEKEEVPLDTRT